jgi:competence protein ComEC
MQRLEVGTLIVPDAQPDDPLRARILALAEAEGAEVRFLLDDDRLTLGEASLTLYAPLGDGGANEEGLSVLATCGDFDALVTGDMNAAVEKRLVKYGNLPDIELLVVGHHGSSYSSSEELLMATRPEYAVISVGYNNYGHPAPEALERLAAAGCEIYRTDLMGTVSITANREVP